MKRTLLLCGLLATGCSLVEAAETDDRPEGPDRPSLEEASPTDVPFAEALRAREEELAKREAELEQARIDLEAARKAVDAKLAKLQARLKELEDAKSSKKSSKESERVERLVQLIETAEKMKPEPAARWLDQFDNQTAADVLHGMSLRRAAAVISFMNPSKAAGLSRLFLENGHPSPPADRKPKER